MSTSGSETIKAERMPFGRWFRIVGWRHIVVILFVLWALFPAFYVISVAFSGGSTLTSACDPSKTRTNRSRRGS